MQEQWGDAQVNNALSIQRSLRNVERIFRDNPEAEFRFSFIRFDSSEPAQQIPPQLLTPDRNWIEQSRIKFQEQHRFYSTSNASLPFSLFPGMSAINGYKLNHFFVLNPNARINAIGIVDLDSDADGLFDFEEDQLGTNYDKTNSRTKGICLDAIVYRGGGCINLGCDQEIDRDGDGLNECEENTLNTQDSDFDTDNDGISDYLEIVYGLNPLLNDRQEDYNSDGVSNYVNFTIGAGPWTYVNEIEDIKKINLNIRETDPIPINTDQGIVSAPAYAFQLLSLPTLSSLSALGAIPTYRNVAKQSGDLNDPPKIPMQFDDTNNRILILGRVDHAQNPGDIFWVFQDILVQDGTTTIPIEIQNMQPMPWRDAVGVSE